MLWAEFIMGCDIFISGPVFKKKPPTPMLLVELGIPLGEGFFVLLNSLVLSGESMVCYLQSKTGEVFLTISSPYNTCTWLWGHGVLHTTGP